MRYFLELIRKLALLIGAASFFTSLIGLGYALKAVAEVYGISGLYLLLASLIPTGLAIAYLVDESQKEREALANELIRRLDLP